MTTYCAPCLADLALVREAVTSVAGTSSCMAHAVLLSHPGDTAQRRLARLTDLRSQAEGKLTTAGAEDQPALELLVQEYALAGAMDMTVPLKELAGDRSPRPPKARRNRPGRSERPDGERGERPERAERPERGDRPERRPRPGAPEHGGPQAQSGQTGAGGSEPGPGGSEPSPSGSAPAPEPAASAPGAQLDPAPVRPGSVDAAASSSAPAEPVPASAAPGESSAPAGSSAPAADPGTPQGSE